LIDEFDEISELYHKDIYDKFNQFIYNRFIRLSVTTMIMFTSLFEAYDFKSDKNNDASIVYTQIFLKEIFNQILLNDKKSIIEKEHSLKVISAMCENAKEDIDNIFDDAFN